MLVKLDHLPRDQGEHKKCLSCHHLVIYGQTTPKSLGILGDTSLNFSYFSPAVRVNSPTRRFVCHEILLRTFPWKEPALLMEVSIRNFTTKHSEISPTENFEPNRNIDLYSWCFFSQPPPPFPKNIKGGKSSNWIYFFPVEQTICMKLHHLSMIGDDFWFPI